MSNEESFIHDLEHHDIKPTAPRLLILEQLHRGDEMLSLPRLEQLLPTVDKSYNISHHDCEDDHDDEEEHTHFYCTRCHRTFCLKQIHVPAVQLPDGFRLETVNYVLKGLCPECSEK